MKNNDNINIDGVGLIILIGCFLLMTLAFIDHNYSVIAIIVTIMIIFKLISNDRIKEEVNERGD